MQNPSVGRMVHYVSYGTPGGEYASECRAAVITAVHDLDPVPAHGVPHVDLCVLNPTGMFFNQDCRYDEGKLVDRYPNRVGELHRSQVRTVRSYPGGTWHWPERVDE